MPPPQRLFASKLRGFVCRSCLLKTRPLRNERPPWLSRSVSSITRPSNAKPRKARNGALEQPGEEFETIIREFDEAPDGTRIERGTAPGDEALLETMESLLQSVRTEMVVQAGTEDIDEDELQDRVLKRYREMMNTDEAMVNRLSADIDARFEQIDAEVDRRLKSIDLESMPEEERWKARMEMFELVSSEAKDAPPIISSSEAGGTEPELPNLDQDFPSNIQEQLTMLIDALRLAAKLLDQRRLIKAASVEIWNAYDLCRKNFVSNPGDVPVEVWETLWNIFTSTKTFDNGYLKLLGQDMLEAGVPMRNWQRLVHIQAMFAEGEQDAAIEQWEQCQMTLSKDDDSVSEYWRVGRVMYTQNHQFREAITTVDSLIRSTRLRSEFRGYIRIIEGILASGNNGKGQQAWKLYTKLSSCFGFEMEFKDYNEISLAFFANNLPDMALAVFRDMMLVGNGSTKKVDSREPQEFELSLRDASDIISGDEKELTSTQMQVLAKLPADFNNKFFFGKWIKALIGGGFLDTIVQVFLLMRERGIRSDARYVNGLIAAWLRTGKSRNYKSAEDAAWRMIEKRIQFVEDRQAFPNLSLPLRVRLTSDKKDNLSLIEYPTATTETFCILIEDYRRRQRHDLLNKLLYAQEQARIRPNASLMNQMMMMDASPPNYHSWDTYTSLTRTANVRPDFDTFGYLWFLTKRAVDPNLNPAEFPKVIDGVGNLAVPRLLISEMMIWAGKSKDWENIPRKLYDQIILCFSLAQDHVGTAIALHALHSRLKMLPNEDTVRTVVLQLARTGLKNEEPRSRRRRLAVKKTSVIRNRVHQVTKILEGFKAKRIDGLLHQGIVFEELSGDKRLEESLRLLTSLLMHVAQMRMEEGQNIADLFEAAGKEMSFLDPVHTEVIS